jgi:heptosyltransferase-2
MGDAIRRVSSHYKMKILILALSGIGDALMFTPAFKLLKENLYDSSLDALVMFKGVRDIFERNKNVDNVLYYDFIHEGAVRSFSYLMKLRHKYDATINVYPSNRREYNIFSFLIGAKKRAAVRYLRRGLRSLGFLNNLTFRENDSLHNVEENIKLAEEIIGKASGKKPQLEFYFNDDDSNYANEFFERINISGRQVVIGFHPGCAVFKNHIKRRWEPEKFAELGKKLIEEYKAKILIFGGPDETELKNRIAEKINSTDVYVIESENLGQTAAIIKRCNLFITNDSSLMHVASALQLNIIVIIGPTNTNYIHPWRTNYKIVSLDLECSPCFFYSSKPLTCTRKDVKFKCIKELTVDMVLKAAIDFLAET